MSKEALMFILDSMNNLEVLNISHCILVEGPFAKATKCAILDRSILDLFGDETKEEKAAAKARQAVVKATTKKKESGKFVVLLDVKPWDDVSDKKKLVEAICSIAMHDLLQGASKLVALGYGIKKLQICMTIVEDLIYVDTVIEEQLIVETLNEYIQSCDIVAFNKI